MRRGASNGYNIRKAMVVSAVVHVSLFASLVVFPDIGLPFREKPMRIDVMWVEIPKGSSDEIGLGLKEAEELPKSTIE
ncbi:MAG TPA: hypothetical protein PLY45_02365, partial [bacterium]|nr:hypothetical protein [bacterium]